LRKPGRLTAFRWHSSMAKFIGHNESLICPLGRLGRCYVLRGIRRRVYNGYVISYFVTAFSLGILNYLVPYGFGNLHWHKFFPVAIGIVVCFIGFIGQYVIASGGAPYPQNDMAYAFIRRKTKSRFVVARDYYFFISGIIMFLFFSLAIVSQLVERKHVPLPEIIFASLALAVAISQFLKK
jgi:hypothetical protein